MKKLIEPTPDEVRNGWDAETLTAYVAEREQAQRDAADPDKREPKRPRVANSRYSPFRWRS